MIKIQDVQVGDLLRWLGDRNNYSFISDHRGVRPNDAFIVRRLSGNMLDIEFTRTGKTGTIGQNSLNECVRVNVNTGEDMSFKSALITRKTVEEPVRIPDEPVKRHVKERFYIGRRGRLDWDGTINRHSGGPLRLRFDQSSECPDRIKVTALDTYAEQKLSDGTIAYSKIDGEFDAKMLLAELAKAIGARVEFDV